MTKKNALKQINKNLDDKTLQYWLGTQGIYEAGILRLSGEEARGAAG